MSYTPTTWTTGDTITASALNKIENGIANAGSALICNSTYNGEDDIYVLDKTVQEIYDAMRGGTPVYIKYQYGEIGQDYVDILYFAPVTKIYNYNYTNNIRICATKESSGYNTIGGKSFTFTPTIMIFSATGLNDYPQFYTSITVPNNYVVTGGHE